MNRTFSHTGRLSAGKPEIQQFPLPLTEAERRDVQRLREALSYPPEALYAEWLTRQGNPKKGSTLYDSWLNAKVGSLFLSPFPQLKRWHEASLAELEAHCALFGVDISSRDKTAVACAVEQLLGAADDTPLWLH